MCTNYNFYVLDIAITGNERSERFQMANFTVPFFSETEWNRIEQNGKNTFILVP